MTPLLLKRAAIATQSATNVQAPLLPTALPVPPLPFPTQVRAICPVLPSPTRSLVLLPRRVAAVIPIVTSAQAV